MNPMKVCIFRASDGACDYYRTLIPMNTAAENKCIKKSEMWVSHLLAKMMHDEDSFMNSMQSDIYFLQRVSSENLIKKIREFKDGIKVDAKLVMDYDDDVFNVSPLSNHYIDYGTEEIKIVHEGKLIFEWKDGVNFNLSKNRKMLDNIKKSCEQVDCITTTTEHLAKVYRQFNDVKVLPNCVDLKQWNKLPLLRKNPDEIRICWQGGHSHWEDLKLVRESLIQIANKYPNVKILMLGYMPVTMEKDFRPGQLEFHPWVETPAHPYRLATLDVDIAIIPLKDTIFNRSKSNIKWVEFSSLGIPCVTSYVQPYDSIQDVDEINKGIFVENNDVNGWVKGLETLIQDKVLRLEIGKNARQFVEKNFDINTQYMQWVNAFEGVRNVNSCKSIA